MIRILLTFFFITLTFPAFACSPPEMPSPPAEIAALHNVNPRTPEQQARLDEYQADQDRIMLIWEQLNPCPMDPEVVKAFEALTPEEKQALETEAKTLYTKWKPEDPHAD